jgi:hypothetical protein
MRERSYTRNPILSECGVTPEGFFTYDTPSRQPETKLQARNSNYITKERRDNGVAFVEAAERMNSRVSAGELHQSLGFNYTSMSIWVKRNVKSGRLVPKGHIDYVLKRKGNRTFIDTMITTESARHIINSLTVR